MNQVKPLGTLLLPRIEGGPDIKPNGQVIGGVEKNFQVGLIDGRLHPYITSIKTGRTVIFSWEELHLMAKWAGLEGFNCGACGKQAKPRPPAGDPPEGWFFFMFPDGLKWICDECAAKVVTKVDGDDDGQAEPVISN